MVHAVCCFRLSRSVCVLLLLIDCSGGSVSLQTSQLSSYEVTVPIRISRQRRDQGSADKVSYIIQAEGKEHVVILERNELLLPEDFTVYSYAKDGSLVTERPNMTGHCHYRGYIEDVEGSSAALSLCSGLRGVIHTEGTSFGIEPLEGSSSNEHLVYRLKNVKTEPLTCGMPHSHNHDDEASPRQPSDSYVHNITFDQAGSHQTRRKRAVLHQTHYVELLLVVDNERFNYKNRNQTAVREEMVQIANYVDSMYIALNIRIVLVGLEIWSLQNPISTDGSAGEVLGRFTQWREKELANRLRHDSAQLILKKGFGSTAGMAFVGAACSRSHGSGINAFTSDDVMSFSSIVAHELGHNLGMNHDDDRNCKCDVTKCIMSSGASGSRNFSSCSADDFEKMILSSGGRCLLNIPRPDEAYSAPFCGNKLVDVGEECDCGSEEECEKDPCCEPKTCKLRSGAQCAYGVCCKHCRFLSGGTICRSSTDECDLPEYCNGTSALCQNDVFKQNGHPCKQDQAYCYNGQCQHYDTQCQAIFGSKAKAAPELCFKDVNSKGDRFGNCGYHSSGFKRCESRNAMCGKLQCENVQSVIFGIKPSIIQTPIADKTCWGVDFQLGSDVPDPGMVNEGTKCGDNKVCLNYECRSADVLNYDCDIEKKCHSHGVCNSNKNCHCEYGWAPPFCEAAGYGGSIDSGPTWNDKDISTRDGLLVFFFLVLPLLALALYVFFKRNELKRRFFRKKRSQGYEADSRPQTTASQWGNPNSIVKDGHQAQLLPPEEVVQTNKSASVPSYATRPPPPPFARPPAPTQQLMPQRPAPAPPV
ncbi:disintegrin and metalloproteinase domain-containing protein 9 isoform X1 [Myxocyprinus asiaticus]|uniref:disintegrin and metalloproteinase domain-containing protein 9 isoform X1 n=2 Tax=Myxocyprinus asiaticus TaxID=70543 RepID=UPI00222312BD|nr:disintegrin and metalloproteinase domain-containing protein 9 isoform X1 [Myxocyprinus asiaticus]